MNGNADPVKVNPTWVRWRIVALLMALSYVSWFLRVGMSVAYDERIKDDLHIAPEAMGWVYSAFLLAYMLCMTPGGWLIDRWGVRAALTVMGFGLVLFGALTGLVGASRELLGRVPAEVVIAGRELGMPLCLFLVIRSVMGVFATPMYPAAAHAVGCWLPFRRRGWANGLVQGSALLGIASTPLVVGTLISWFDWPQTFLILAIGTALLTIVWALYATDRPEQHAAVNRTELSLIATESAAGPATGASEPDVRTAFTANRPTRSSDAVPAADESDVSSAIAPVQSGHLGTSAAAVDGARPPGPWTLLLRNRSLVCLTLSYAAVGYFEYLFFFWMDYYFKDELKLPDEVRRIYAGIPFLAMAAGMAAGGWISDRLVRLYGHRTGRAIVPVAGMLIAAVFLLLGVAVKQPEWIVLCFAVALGAGGSVEAPTWTTAVELGGRRGGTAAGICNTGGNAGGLIAPVVTPLVAREFGWTAAIAVASAVCIAGVLLWRWIDPHERAGDES
jgi:MFS family permease